MVNTLNDGDELSPSSVMSSVLSNLHTIRLDTKIVESCYYREEFYILENAGINDIVNIHIDSNGGDLYTALQFINKIKACRATVYGILEGKAWSAAGMIFLSCPEFEVKRFSSFMAHNGGSALEGTSSSNHERVSFSFPYLKEIMEENYKGFLTKEEIDKVMSGSDVWLKDRDVISRLTDRYHLQKRHILDDLEDELNNMEYDDVADIAADEGIDISDLTLPQLVHKIVDKREESL